MRLRSRMTRAALRQKPLNGMLMSDARAFLGSYKDALQQEVASGGWPEEWQSVYDPESCLKHSGAKEVYLVCDRRTGGHVILRSSDLDANERADAEHAILSRLDFPGIPKTYGTLIKGSRSYLAREYFDGEPLDQVIARGVMQPAWIYHIARQICGILGYLHSQAPPVIHRDIKPQNIILRPDGSLGLTDFGIARTFKEGSDSDTHYLGTLPYAPPEQYGYAQSSPQTDIYALGIVLIYLATGSPNRQDLAQRIPDARLRSLIERCIAFDPKDRFQSVDAVVRRIDTMKTRPLRIGATIAAGLLVLALVGLGIGLFLQKASNDSPAANGQDGQGGLDGQEAAYAPGPASSRGAGNLAGNIVNGGFAVAGDEVVYLAVADSILELQADGTTREVISGVSEVASLNYYEGALYFSSYQEGLVRVEPATGRKETLISEPTGTVFIDGGLLYYENAVEQLNLFVVGLDGTGKRQVDAYDGYYTVVADGYHYFANRDDDERLWRVDVQTGEGQRLYDARLAWIAPYEGRLYFSDFSIPGALMAAEMDGSGAVELYHGSCSRIVASPEGLVFENDNGKLTLLPLEGGPALQLTGNESNGHCVVGEWVFYKNGSEGDALWMVRTDGTEDQRFVP